MIRQPGKPLGEEHNCHHQCQKKNYHRHCHEVKMVLLRIFRCMTLLHTGDGDGAAMAVAQVAHCSAIFLCYLVGLQWLWPRQLSFSLYRRVLQVKWPLKQLKYLRIFIVTKFLFVKKLAIYSCFFWLKRDNQVFECFSPFPFSSGHAGHHRKSKREVEAKGKHIDKVNLPRKWKFGAKPKFWHQCINARVRGAAWTVQNMKQSKICKNK